MVIDVIRPVFDQNNDLMLSDIRKMEKILSSCQNNCQSPIVRAASLINRGSITDVINIDSLLDQYRPPSQVVNISETNGRLFCIEGQKSSTSWIKMINIADNFQSFNVELINTKRGLFLRTTQLISPNEPLHIWFSQDILEMMNIPFCLNPSNIQDENHYLCHICHARFENPNPLKIHLALECNHHAGMNHLWNNLTTKLCSSPELKFRPQPVPGVFKFELSCLLEASLIRIESPIGVETFRSRSSSISPISTASSSDLSSSSLSEISPKSLPLKRIRHMDYNRQSAFQPYSIQRSHPYNNLSSTILNHSLANFHHKEYYYLHAHSHLQPQFSPQPQPQPQPQRLPQHLPQFHPEPHFYAPPGYHHVDEKEEDDAFYGALPVDKDSHAARLEIFLSNLGKAKDGHRCFQCGKLYSRKYGLKIHIRTHTGYKPLKCKFCLRAFGDPSNLNKHVRLHAEGDTPYKCNTCGKVAVRKRDLDRHINAKHNGNRIEQVSDTESDSCNITDQSCL